MNSILRDLEKIVGYNNVKEDMSIKELTTFKVGGPCDIFVEPSDEESLINAYMYLNEKGIRHIVMGNGSNFFVDDAGYRGVFLKIGRKLSGINVNGNIVDVLSGTTNHTIGEHAIKCGLSGFECCAGIPGTIGGAVYMNAGAYGGEIASIIESAKILFADSSEPEDILKDDLKLGYRNSILHDKKGIVLSAKLLLEKKDSDSVRNYTRELMERRKSKQPLEYPSGGSFFKRPEGYYAGKLIEDSGLRGFRIGDAQISEKHCGFVINRGNATSKDLLNLRDYVVNKVYKEFGVTLEMEVRSIGEYDE